MHNNVERQWQHNQARRVSRLWRKERDMYNNDEPELQEPADDTWLVYSDETPAPIPVPMEDDLVHTDEHPFCSDDSCPCHMDSDLVNAQVNEPYSDGLLTSHEANRLRRGEQL